MTILDRYAGLIIDLDGVVVRGDEPIREAIAFLRRQRRTVPVALLTNNSTRTPEAWSQLLAAHKVDVDPGRILTSAAAAARLLVDGSAQRCLVIGEEGLQAELDRAGLTRVDDPETADAVVLGWDRSLTYDALAGAATALRRGARFVATNPDPVTPGPTGPLPGNGAAIAYLKAATGVAPEVAGKPQTALLHLAVERLEVDGPILVVGDQVATDVVAAAKMDFESALVLSGVSGWDALVDAAAAPTWVVAHLGALDGPEPPIVRRAREADLSAIRALLTVESFDATGAAARLPDTLVAEGPDGDIVGVIAWELLEEAAHLRGVTVADHERGLGTGSHLVVRALRELDQLGVQWVYLLTPGADQLFEKLGFWRVHRERVPDDILATATYGPAASGGIALMRRLGR